MCRDYIGSESQGIHPLRDIPNYNRDHRRHLWVITYMVCAKFLTFKDFELNFTNNN